MIPSTRPRPSFLQRLFRPIRIGIRRHPLLPFLLAATVAVDLVVVFSGLDKSLGGVETAFDLVWDFIFTSVQLGQFCLLGIWVVYQWPGVSYRLGIAATMVALLPYLRGGDDFGRAASLAFLYAGSSALLVAVGKLIAQRSSLAVPNFRVTTLLQLTTSVAIVAAFGRYFQTPLPRDEVLFLFVMTMLASSLYGIRNWRRSLSVSLALVACAMLIMLGVTKYLLEQGRLPFSLFEWFLLVSLAIGSYAGIIMLWVHGLKVRNVPFRQARKRRQEQLRKQAALDEPGQPVVISDADLIEPAIEPPDEPGPLDLIG